MNDFKQYIPFVKQRVYKTQFSLISFECTLQSLVKDWTKFSTY